MADELTLLLTLLVMLLGLLGVFALVAFVFFLATSYGARRFGASKWDTVGDVLAASWARSDRSPGPHVAGRGRDLSAWAQKACRSTILRNSHHRKHPKEATC